MPATFKSRISQVILFLAAGAGVLAWWGPGFALFVLVFLLAPLVLERFSLRFLVFRSGIKAPVSRGLALACAGLWGAGAYGIMMMINAGQAAMAAAWAAGLVALPMLLFKPLPVRTWQYTLMLVVYPVFAFFMFTGEVLGLAHVETHFWGGLYLTLVIAVTGLVACLPIGILLALGRQSKMPAIKFICVFFIEIVRGVPLVSVLFMASVMFPLFLPPGAHFDKLLRALIGVSFFYAVYIAEVIRGGLQAIPKGQYEAAQALGWGYWKMMSLIIIPQTLRLVIPGLANNILSLFKDTTLVAVIGLLDLLGVAKAAMADAQWLGFTKEAYVFAGLVFWILCFSISRYSNHLEKKYHSSYH
ncbi:MAG: amino acid ABC transporter permease [Desulfobacter sp.]|nr:MAG: amino acid ABC transporter permease [Desulfobacter sp.]